MCLRGSVLGMVLGKPPACGYRVPESFCWFARAVPTCRVFAPFRLTTPTIDCCQGCRCLSGKGSAGLVLRRLMIGSQLVSDATIISDPAWEIGMHNDITMSAIQTSLAALKEGSTLATKLPFIAPIASLLLQALTMRDEVKQYKEECEIVMHKLTRIARIIVDVGELCEHHNLTEGDLPTGLRTILDSL
ncbi:hypothetical protein H4582DRAFT_1478176 [Lactarius indigo]|nr:hypothetical protein H4582DRAFT_1478176 [Lactarius indigo]